jgi:hypothetical protein
MAIASLALFSLAAAVLLVAFFLMGELASILHVRPIDIEECLIMIAKNLLSTCYLGS